MLLNGRKFRPDFYLSDYNLFVEICGYNHQPYYRDRIEYKKQIYNKNDLKAVFVNYDGYGDLRSIIAEKLGPFGLKFINQ